MLNPNIKTFLTVAELGSFSLASEQLYLSKVSVMNQINNLEKHIGVSLFIRTHQGVSLTDAGKSFYKNAKKMMKLSEDYISEVRQLGGSQSQIIRIGTSLMRPYNTLMELWNKIDTQENNYQFNIVPFNDDIDSLTPLLHSIGDKIDCFASACSSMDILMDYNFLPISSCQCAIAMPRNHRLANREILYWEDLIGESLILVKRGISYIVDELRDDIYNHHQGINIVDFNGYYGVSTFNMCEQKGYLMQTLDIWESLHPSLITKPIQWKYKMPFGIIYSKKPSQSIQSFIDIIAKSA